MLNFGALIAFMGVNAAAFVRYYVRAEKKQLRNLIPPLLGFAVCLLLWLSLSRTAQIAGSIWMAAGDCVRSLENPRVSGRSGGFRDTRGRRRLNGGR
jgi:hypothetical protein